MIPAPRKPTDTAKFRETYLNELRMEEANLERQRKALTQLEETGAPPMQRDDTRSVYERRRDLEFLKISILGDLKDLTDGREAAIILSSLDGDEILFVADNMPIIKSDIMPKFQFGIPAMAFLPYVRTLMKNSQESIGINYGLQQNGARNYITTGSVISRKLPTDATLSNLEGEVDKLGDSDLKRRIKDMIGIMRTQVPQPEEILALDQMKGIEAANLKKLLDDVVENIPTKKQIDTILRKLEGNNDPQDLQNILLKLEDLLSLPAEDILERAELVDKMGRLVGEADLPFTAERDTSSARAEAEAEAIMVEAITPEAVSSPAEFKKLNKNVMVAFLIEKKQLGELETSFTNTKIQQSNKATLTELYTRWYNNTQSDTAAPAEKYPAEKLMSGTGMVRAKKIARRVDLETGIKKEKDYVRFGKYIINQHQLKGGNLMIKYPSLNSIASLPTRKISGDLVRVFKDIIGGKNPNYESMGKLSDDEKELLHSVSTKSNIDERISIPTPAKNNDQKDVDRFLLLKGQITAGNNNPIVIREFKKLLIKMLKQKRIPRGEALEILEFLTSIGY
jgi:hypothetical protein